MRMRMILPPDILKRFADLPGESTHLERRNLSVQPVLLIGKCLPRLRHPRIATERRLAFRALRQLQAVFRVFPENVRLFHNRDMGREQGDYN